METFSSRSPTEIQRQMMMMFNMIFLIIIVIVNAQDKKCCFCIPPASHDYCVVEGTKGGLLKKAALTLRKRRSLIPDDMRPCENLCHPFDTMKVNRKRKVAMTCDEYLQSHKSVKMCHEWDVWDEFEGDEHFSLKSDEGSFESDEGSFEVPLMQIPSIPSTECHTDSFHTAISTRRRSFHVIRRP